MRLAMTLLESFSVVTLQEMFVLIERKMKLSMPFEFIIHYYYWCFRSSWRQIGISHLKWISMFLTAV